ncbi:MAG TPA: undecaprenyl-phosphate glucose phosphotransferase [Anaerolineae bacterium]|nr:undecaprenyl-phosphate glucose phosphotransferase [Anaerolineae bacterium]
MTKRRPGALLSAILLISDVVMSGLAFWLAYQLRRLTPHQNILPFDNYLGMMAVHVLAVVIVFAVRRSYYDRHPFSQLDEFYDVSGNVLLGSVTAIALISVLFKESLDYPRLMMFYSLILTIVLVTLGRLIHTWVQWLLLARGWGRRKVLLVGSGDVGQMILHKIRQSPRLGYEVAGFIDGTVGGVVMGIPVLGQTRDLPQLIEEHNIEEVIIGLPESSHQEVLNVISLCEREKVSIRVFPDVFQIMATEVSIGDLGGLPLLTMRDVALRGWRLTVKRAMDVAISGTGLVVISPLMLLTALLIKLDSRGPVFFVQERTGLDGRPFLMLKFRSMRQDAEAHGPGWTTEDDPRRTRLGSIIRKLSVDELPQLINVLLGDMSLVGPRPEQPAYVEQFRRNIPRYMDRHREKAGLTGWAQVNGLRGDTSITERTKYDLWYIENWSLWLDINIIIRTVLQGLTSRSAY